MVWNPVRGCSLVSPGCTNCYAMRQAHRHSGPTGSYEGLTVATSQGPKWSGRARVVPELLDLPLRWKKPRRIFVNSMSDLFHEDVPDEFIDGVFAVMMASWRHTYQILTKRPERMLAYMLADGLEDRIIGRLANDDRMFEARDNCGTLWPMPHVWLGVSVEDQELADERIPLLLQTPAAVRWISAEPLLGPIDLSDWRRRYDVCQADEWLDWVVAGAESGPRARPMSVDWIRSLRDHCARAMVPFFYKQAAFEGRKIPLPMLDGERHQAYPA